MKKRMFVAIGIIAVLSITAGVIWGRGIVGPKPNPQTASTAKVALISGPGRVEPASENIQLGSELSGKLARVYVEEGYAVQRGEVLAELENRDYHAAVASAAADVAQKEAELRKVINGARSQERSEALSSVNEAEAVMNNAHSDMVRRHELFAAGVISREEDDHYAKEYDVAKARFDEMKQHYNLVDANAREEDQAMAEANLQLARARLQQEQAVLEKTYIRAPLDGTVLRKLHRQGESVSNSATTPDPIFTLGDRSSLRVRVDVDEADVSKLSLGEKAYVTADAYGTTRFPGHIVRIGQQLGRKNVRTDEPTEHVDMKILETLVELDKGVDLPVGLRVTAFIDAGQGAESASLRP